MKVTYAPGTDTLSVILRDDTAVAESDEDLRDASYLWDIVDCARRAIEATRELDLQRDPVGEDRGPAPRLGAPVPGDPSTTTLTSPISAA